MKFNTAQDMAAALYPSRRIMTDAQAEVHYNEWGRRASQGTHRSYKPWSMMTMNDRHVWMDEQHVITNEQLQHEWRCHANDRAEDEQMGRVHV